VPTTAELLDQALAHHRAGRLRDAEPLYRAVLEADGTNFDACRGLGAILHACGHLPEAIACFERAVRLRPAHAEARLDLGVALAQADRLDESAANLEAASRLAPGAVEIAEALRHTRAMQQNRLAIDFVRRGKLDEAAACCRKAVELTPNQAAAHENLGNVLKGQGRLDDAAACYRRAVELDDTLADSHRNLGLFALQQERFEEAAARFRRLLELKPGLVEAHNQLGAALTEQKQFGPAEACFRRAIELQPGHAEAHNNLGTALARQRKMSEAAEWFSRALRLKSDYAEAHVNLATALKDQNKLSEAVTSFRRALELKPDDPIAKLAFGMTLLALGKLAEGWPYYESRWKTGELKGVTLPEPRWTGDDLADRTILLGREQGLGDTLQFVRYAEPVKRRGGKVIVECAPQLAKLLMTCPGVDRLVVAGEPLPPFDVFAPLLSLPRIFGTTLESIPASVPYLRPEPSLVETWRGDLAGEKGFKVGIAWQGRRANPADEVRSIPLLQFEPLARIAGVRLYSLQVGEGTEQLAEVAGDWPITDLGERLGDFHNTAAIMRNLDLVITCDSAAAHLAGAIGTRVWIALAFAPDWRWMLEREDSPWYPTARLFRQRRLGDWGDVFARMADELAQWIAGSRADAPRT
jgi:tetratricopeptide (TPR) repeat protein